MANCFSPSLPSHIPDYLISSSQLKEKNVTVYAEWKSRCYEALLTKLANSASYEITSSSKIRNEQILNLVESIASIIKQHVVQDTENIEADHPLDSIADNDCFPLFQIPTVHSLKAKPSSFTAPCAKIASNKESLSDINSVSILPLLPIRSSLLIGRLLLSSQSQLQFHDDTGHIQAQLIHCSDMNLYNRLVMFMQWSSRVWSEGLILELDGRSAFLLTDITSPLSKFVSLLPLHKFTNDTLSHYLKEKEREYRSQCDFAMKRKLRWNVRGKILSLSPLIVKRQHFFFLEISSQEQDQSQSTFILCLGSEVMYYYYFLIIGKDYLFLNIEVSAVVVDESFQLSQQVFLIRRVGHSKELDRSEQSCIIPLEEASYSYLQVNPSVLPKRSSKTLPLLHSSSHSSCKHSPTVTYQGTVTAEIGPLVFELDGSFQVANARSKEVESKRTPPPSLLHLYLTHYQSAALPYLAVGSKITLYNVHAIVLDERFFGFGACVYSHIRINEFSPYLINSRNVLSRSLLSYYTALSLPNTAALFDSLHQVSQKLGVSRTSKHLLGNGISDQTAPIQLLMGQTLPEGCLRDIYAQFFEHWQCNAMLNKKLHSSSCLPATPRVFPSLSSILELPQVGQAARELLLSCESTDLWPSFPTIVLQSELILPSSWQCLALLRSSMDSYVERCTSIGVAKAITSVSSPNSSATRTSHFSVYSICTGLELVDNTSSLDCFCFSSLTSAALARWYIISSFKMIIERIPIANLNAAGDSQVHPYPTSKIVVTLHLSPDNMIPITPPLPSIPLKIENSKEIEFPSAPSTLSSLMLLITHISLSCVEISFLEGYALRRGDTAKSHLVVLQLTSHILNLHPTLDVNSLIDVTDILFLGESHKGLPTYRSTERTSVTVFPTHLADSLLSQHQLRKSVLSHVRDLLIFNLLADMEEKSCVSFTAVCLNKLFCLEPPAETMLLPVDIDTSQTCHSGFTCFLLRDLHFSHTVELYLPNDSHRLHGLVAGGTVEIYKAKRQITSSWRIFIIAEQETQVKLVSLSSPNLLDYSLRSLSLTYLHSFDSFPSTINQQHTRLQVQIQKVDYLFLQHRCIHCGIVKGAVRGECMRKGHSSPLLEAEARVTITDGTESAQALFQGEQVWQLLALTRASAAWIKQLLQKMGKLDYFYSKEEKTTEEDRSELLIDNTIGEINNNGNEDGMKVDFGGPKDSYTCLSSYERRLWRGLVRKEPRGKTFSLLVTQIFEQAHIDAYHAFRQSKTKQIHSNLNPNSRSTLHSFSHSSPDPIKSLRFFCSKPWLIKSNYISYSTRVPTLSIVLRVWKCELRDSAVDLQNDVREILAALHK